MSANYEALLRGGKFRLNRGDPLETPVVVTYSFAEKGDFPELDRDYKPRRYETFSERDRDHVREALDEYERRTGLTFVEVANRGQLDFMTAVGADGTSWAYYPRERIQPVVINRDWVREGLAEGRDGFQVLLHEIGHATGLKHPFEGRDQLPARLDSQKHTVMSYAFEKHASGELGHIDIAALNHYYGGPTGWAITLNEVKRTARFTDGDGASDLGFDNFALAIIARGGDDTLRGNDTHDTLDGGAGNDVIYSAKGNDLAMGRAGDDLIEDRGGGRNTLKGGAGDDTIRTGDGNDLISGGSGDDIVEDSGGNDTVRGGPGDDHIDTARGDDLILAGAGHDDVYTERGDDTIEGQRGNDTLRARYGDNYLRGGAGEDRLEVNGSGDSTLIGGTGDDTLVNTYRAASLMRGGSGDDVLESYSGSNIRLFGDAGDDRIRGNHHLFGGSGNDTLRGQGGDDTLKGEGGNDMLIGGPQDDLLSGGAGNDTLLANAPQEYDGDSVDILRGGSGNDVLQGDGGSAHLIGGAGDDTLRSGNRASFLRDTLDGGAGDDQLSIQTRPREVWRDEGKIIVYGNGYGRDEVTGFTDRDFLDIRVKATSPESLLDLARQAGDDAVFDFGHGDSLVLLDVAVSLLDETMFV